MRIHNGQFERNVETGFKALKKAVEQKAQITVLPELWTSGYDLENAGYYAKENIKVLRRLSQFCQTNNIWCVAGSFILKRKKGELVNSCMAFDANGRRISSYEKMHLFPALGENRVFERGDHPKIFNTPWGKAGLALCFDIRFPEIFRHYFQKKVKIVFIPAQFPFPRIAHWKILLKARALEDNCFIIACNAASHPDQKRRFGFSSIIDPWGDEVIKLEHQESVIAAELNLDRIVDADKKLYLRKSVHPRF